MENHKGRLFRSLLTAGYLIGFSVLAYMGTRFHAYYALPLPERPHSPLHLLAKPGGQTSHGLGIAGGAMILLLFLYSVRKREVIRWGSLSRWLDTHIMLGILGPLFVTLHTAFKFGGIVSVSYFSMMAVMASGIFGRYLYIQIPRAITGGELSPKDIAARRGAIRDALAAEFGLSDKALDTLEGKAASPSGKSRSAWRILLNLMIADLIRPFRSFTMRRRLRRSHPGLPPEKLGTLAGGIKELSILDRKVRFLDTTQRIFHYWHVIHRPFAYVVVVIMLIHVAVVTYLGYRWFF